MKSTLGPHRVEISELPALLRAGCDIVFRQPIFFFVAMAVAGLVGYFIALSIGNLDLLRQRGTILFASFIFGSIYVSLAVLLSLRDDNGEFNFRILRKSFIGCLVFSAFCLVTNIFFVGLIETISILFVEITGLQLPPSAPASADYGGLIDSFFKGAFFLVFSCVTAYSTSALSLSPLESLKSSLKSVYVNVHLAKIFIVVDIAIALNVRIIVMFFPGEEGSMPISFIAILALSPVFAAVMYPIARRIMGGPTNNAKKANDAEIFSAPRSLAEVRSS